jgi:hypothetical protein
MVDDYYQTQYNYFSNTGHKSNSALGSLDINLNILDTIREIDFFQESEGICFCR